MDIASNGEIKTFLGHELVQRFHTAGGSRLYLNGDDTVAVLNDIVDFSLSSAGRLPVKKPWFC